MGPTAISLFSSAGIGEQGLKANGYRVLVANEIVPSRCRLYRENYPETRLFEGDIWDLRSEVMQAAREELKGAELDLVYATPPCQGMSSNGVGKLAAEARLGNRPSEDPRNRLVIPAMDIIRELRPKWVLFENVPNMQYTAINTDDGVKNIVEYIGERLGPEYAGKAEVLRCSDYGIPQLRKRLITIFTRLDEGKQYLRANGNTFFPPSERARTPTLRDAIGSFPPLDAVKGSNSRVDFHPLHYVHVMDPEKHWWVSNTAEGDTAFNNQCVNPDCGFQGNPRHIDQLANGRWSSNKATPFLCMKCGELLPRPTMIDGSSGTRRLISGFHSAYRRMRWDEPSRTLTRNVFFEASDNKIHPNQNRPLSVYEALVIQTIHDYDYTWTVNGKQVPRGHIASAIGESVPPRLIDFIASKVRRIQAGSLQASQQLLAVSG